MWVGWINRGFWNHVHFESRLIHLLAFRSHFLPRASALLYLNAAFVITAEPSLILDVKQWLGKYPGLSFLMDYVSFGHWVNNPEEYYEWLCGVLWTGPSGQGVRKVWKPCGGPLLAGLLADPDLWQSTVVLDNWGCFLNGGWVQFLGIWWIESLWRKQLSHSSPSSESSKG